MLDAFIDGWDRWTTDKRLHTRRERLPEHGMPSALLQWQSQQARRFGRQACVGKQNKGGLACKRDAHLDKLWNRRAAPCLVNDALCQQHLGCALGHFDDAASGRAHERGLTVGQLGGGWRRACALGLQRLRGGNARRHGEPCTCMHARTHACQFADSLVCGQSSLHAWGLTVGIECEGRVTRACSAIKVEHTQTCIASGMQACMQCDRSEAHAKHVHPWACNHAMQDDLRVQLNADSTQGMRHVQQYQRTHGGGSGADSPRSWRPLR